ncbi:MAG: diacylglycerol kinase family lipid kinase [Tannerellaceae bacterium]|jgi:YegS/Rv2252/BmrU family lipid kinase|nr:diacylglycerol kinase family lipid kinase [Tannerellaceae bacterium]
MKKEHIDVQAIINPVSGVGSKRAIPKLIEKIYESRNLALNITFTEYAGHAKLLTKNALKQGARYILAVGGDGTVNEIAAAMINSEATLGIIPRGSGNGLARDLQIPMDTRKAVELILKDHVTVIDGCVANRHIFFTTCGVGFDAMVSQKFATEKRRGSMTYVRRAIQEYLNYKPEEYELHIDDRAVTEKAFLVACANASQYGNNAFIAPHANMTDGKMDITILSPFTALDVPNLAFQLFTRQIEKNSKIKIIQTDRLTIIRRNPGVMHLDGDPIMAGKKITVNVLPKVLKVFTPETLDAKSERKNLFGQVVDLLNSHALHR